MLISQLPQIVKEAAGGLAGANVSVLNGADGLGEIAAGLVSQGLTILESVRRSVGSSADQPSSNGNGTSPRRLPSAPTAPTGPDGPTPGR
jgi:flotillin